MKSTKQIVVMVVLAISAFCAILYGSCSKDSCKGVTCLNYGTCSGAMCTCPPGTGGNNCQTVYRKIDSGMYVGKGAKDTGSVLPDSATMTFSPTQDTIFTNMQLSVTDSSNGIIFSNYAITITGTSSTGTTFSLAASYDTLTISGTGSVNGTTASMNLSLFNTKDSLYRTISYNSFTKEP